MQLQITEEVFKVKQIEDRLQEIMNTIAKFRDTTQEIIEVIQGILAWLETNQEQQENTPIKASERLQLEYELIGFSKRVAEKLIEAVQKTVDKCREFSKKVLATYNRFQTSSKKRLDELPAHEDICSIYILDFKKTS